MRRYISPRSTATHCRGYLDPLRLLRHVTPSHAYISGRQVITAPIILSHIPPSSINNGVRELIIVRDIRPTEREALPPRIIFSCIGGAFALDLRAWIQMLKDSSSDTIACLGSVVITIFEIIFGAIECIFVGQFARTEMSFSRLTLF